MSPNVISCCSALFSAFAAWALLEIPGVAGPLLCAFGIALRGLCNLADGLVAIEHGKQTAVGILYNEVPDRISDSVLFVALGYAAGVVWLGWLVALLATCTAYVRLLGGSLGLKQDFSGPQSKSQRMTVMAVACFAHAGQLIWWPGTQALAVGVALIAVGSGVTCASRLVRMARRLESREVRS